MHDYYFDTVDKIREWAYAEPEVHGVIALGSQVRNFNMGDEWSDLDLLVFVDTPDRFMHDDEWVEGFGETACVVKEVTPLEWIRLDWSVKRVIFADHRAVDISLLPADRVDDVLAMNAEIHMHGYEVIYDSRAPVLDRKIELSLTDVKEETPLVPTETELNVLVNGILFQLMHAGRKLMRNELWVAAGTVNGQVSGPLLQLIELHVNVCGTPGSGIRYDGRFLEQRISVPVLERLSGCFAHYDSQDTVRAISSVLDTVRVIAAEICGKLDYPFCERMFDTLRGMLFDMFGDAYVSRI